MLDGSEPAPNGCLRSRKDSGRFVGETVEIEPRHHAQFQRTRINGRKIDGQRKAGTRAASWSTYEQHVAGGKLAAGESAQRSEAV